MSGTGICGLHVMMAHVLFSGVKCLVLASEGARKDGLGFVLLSSFLLKAAQQRVMVASTSALRLYTQRLESEVSLCIEAARPPS